MIYKFLSSAMVNWGKSNHLLERPVGAKPAWRVLVRDNGTEVFGGPIMRQGIWEKKMAEGEVVHLVVQMNMVPAPAVI